ncbi:MAG TPA: hypothetical protein VD793_08835, partial [Gemmatimonadales bacterium]|nr:hypothetical protein [Gemmatimonadales bacterium]
MTEPNETGFEPTEADRLLDLYLATLPRFEPGAEFAERVMARLAVTHSGLVAKRQPQAVALAALSRPAVRWSLAGTSAFTGAAFTGLALATLASPGQMVTAVTTGAVGGWQALLALIAAWSVWTGQSLARVLVTLGPEFMMSLTAGAVLAMPVGVIGLWLAVRPALSS